MGSRGNTRLTRACRKPYMKSVIWMFFAIFRFHGIQPWRILRRYVRWIKFHKNDKGFHHKRFSIENSCLKDYWKSIWPFYPVSRGLRWHISSVKSYLKYFSKLRITLCVNYMKRRYSLKWRALWGDIVRDRDHLHETEEIETIVITKENVIGEVNAGSKL